MNFLVDPDVLSEPTKPAPSSKVIAWLSADEGNLVVDSIILSDSTTSPLPRATRAISGRRAWRR